MDAEIYTQMAAVEQHHWWFVARREIIAHCLQRLQLPDKAEIFEAGCGTGGNLALLSQYGQVWAMELNAEARIFASRQQGINLAAGMLPDDIPFAGQKFDLIVLLDVLEHVQADREALIALRSRLKINGYLLITVPALPLLWSEHDERHHHQRRYYRGQIGKYLKESEFKIIKLSYFNFWLFPMVLIMRFVKNLFKLKNQDDTKIPAIGINNLLRYIFSSERYLLDYISLPIGVSILAIAQRMD